MKTFLLACIILAGFTSAKNAEASSFVFKQIDINVEVGKTFTLPVVIDPADIPQYTVRLSMAFSPDLLEVTSFIFGGNWFTLSQPGYDSIDNRIGELIKTGGFPRGFSSPVPLGAITFRAKKPGESRIIVGSQSFVLNAQNNNTLESGPQIQVIATAAVKGPAGEIPSISQVPSTPQAPSIQPIPNLPPTGENIPYINPVSEQKGIGAGAVFLLILLLVAIYEIIRRVILTKPRRRR